MAQNPSYSGARAESSASPQVNSYSYAVVVTLAFVYMLNFLDRQILAVLAEPVKQDLGLSDTQLGALTGLMFALFYTVFGVPMALIADRGHRVGVIAAACGLWSLFTAACGFATNFFTLALARIGVGVGEAGCSPPAYSIISDYFPPEKRGRALAIYLLGVPAGSLVGTMAAGWIAAHYGWRTAFIALGVVGVLIAPLILLIVREPKRGRFEPEKAKPPATAGEQRTALAEAFQFYSRSPGLIFNALGAGLTAFVSYGIMNWSPAFLTRVLDMELSDIALYYAPAIALSMVAGAALGAYFADKLGVRNPIYYALMPGIGLLVITPFLFAFTNASDWQTSIAFLIVPMVLTSTYLVPALALLQNTSPPHLRATTSSLLLFLINLTGLGFGPLLVGAVSDWLQPEYGARALGFALQWLTPFIVLAFLCQCAAAWHIHLQRRRQEGAPG